MTGTIVVTGAAGTLGRETARVLPTKGWSVLGIDLAAGIPEDGTRLFGGIDLTDEDAMGVVAATIEREVGALAGLVNIAGGFLWERIEDGSVASWEKLFAMNVKTTLVASRALLPLLIDRGGAIVNVGAAASLRAGLGMGAYAASKSGVSRLTEALAEEFKDRGVRVNAVLPSIIDTSANRRDIPDAEFDRWVTPGQLAKVIAFLLSGDAAVTGASIPITGRV